MTSQMRILLVSEATSEMLGGVTTEVRRLINGLRGRGHRLALVSEAPLSGADADHFKLHMPRSETTLEQLRRSIADFKPDIVHVVFAFSGGALFFARELRNHPWVLTCHSVPPSEWTLRRLHGHERLHYLVRAIRFWPETWLATRLYAARVPPRVIVHSDFMKRVVAGRLYPARRVDVIPFGFEPPDPTWPSDRLAVASAPQLLTIGGITHSKGHHDAIEALAIVRRRHPGVRYAIMGEPRDPSYLQFLRQRAEQLDLSGSVTFVISATTEQIDAALATADLFVQPSHEEGFCLSYMEAAAQVPRLVGTRTGAIVEMSRDDPGATTVAVGDPRALADAIVGLLGAVLSPAAMSQRSSRLSARFPRNEYFALHERVYGYVVAAAAVGSAPRDPAT
jgi:glycosyltransferase involved in cell wall biosynthesis